MAAGGLYTIGGSFWEFGEPDWEHTKYFMMFGVAEDHDSNPIKIGLAKLKEAQRQVRLGQPGAHRLLGDRRRMARHHAGHRRPLHPALVHELLKAGKVDLDYLVRYTNAPWLVVQDPGGADDGLFARDGRQSAVLGPAPRTPALTPWRPRSNRRS